MTSLVTPARLAEAVRRRLEASACDVNAYWMRVTEDRDAYASAVSDELRDDPVVVVVIRDGRFTNPNALLSDFVELVAQNESLCQHRLDQSQMKCAFVLLSRTELTIAQVSSPVVLPTWFPIGGGTTMSMLIEDLTWTADAPLGAPEVRIAELGEGLFDLEEALFGRVREVAASDHRKTNGFLDVIRNAAGEKLEDILEAAAQHHASITTPAAFRPSLRDGRSLIARLWRVAQERQAEQMKVPSKALADALDLPEQIKLEWHESISSVLRRPSGGEANARLRFSRNVFLTVATACQLITGSAHSDDYGHYPVLLLRSFSYDLRRSLADAETVVRALAN